MEWIGFALLILVGIGIISTGLPAAFVLIAVASLGAGLGLLTGTIPFSLLWALPGRLINLFDNDLLQALPLYVAAARKAPVAAALFPRSAGKRGWVGWLSIITSRLAIILSAISVTHDSSIIIGGLRRHLFGLSLTTIGSKKAKASVVI